jgi:hypothetical protein
MSHITQKELQEAYKEFFGTDKGQLFITQIEKMIDLNHRNAENTPELTRDFFQRAKGNREVIEHIRIVLGGVKK